MIEKGKVISVKGNIAEISMIAGDSCSSCPARGSCRLSEGIRVIDADNSIGAKQGDIVRIEIAGKAGLSAALIIFGIPVIMAVVGLIISSGMSETSRIAITVAGLIFGLVIAKIVDRISGNKRNFIPYIIDKES